MSNRYDTLNVSLQTDSRSPSKLVKTLDYQNVSHSDQQGQSDNKVRRFRQLYYKNQRLRRQLKVLNQKLNDRLDRVKLPSVKKKTMSVDLNRSPVNKAQTRELQNGYKQIKMYKKQIEILKVKEQTPQNYAKLRSMENSIAYRDKEIIEVQQQLKSIKNVKKLQQRTIVSDLQNEDVIERMQQYKQESDQFKVQLKEGGKKGRKRELEYKKQQAYQVTLEKKLRGISNEEQQKIEIQKPPERQITNMEWNLLKEQVTKEKQGNEQVINKIETNRKQIRHIKQVKESNQQTLQKKEAQYRNLLIKLESLRKLLKEQERQERERERSREKENQKNKNQQLQKMHQKMLMEDDSEQDDEDSQLQGSPKDSPSKISSIRKDQRQWRGKKRKLQHGFMAPTDQRFQVQGTIRGFKVFLDQNQVICGLSPIITHNTISRQTQIVGNRSNIELKWETNQKDQISRVAGTFSQQGYLNELLLTSKNGMSAKFGGNQNVLSQDVFKFTLEADQTLQGVYGAVRRLNKDARITQLGFWITKAAKDIDQKSFMPPSSGLRDLML